MTQYYKNFERKPLQQPVIRKGKNVDITLFVMYNLSFIDYALSKLSKEPTGSSKNAVWHDICRLVWCLSSLSTY